MKRTNKTNLKVEITGNVQESFESLSKKEQDFFTSTLLERIVELSQKNEKETDSQN